MEIKRGPGHTVDFHPRAGTTSGQLRPAVVLPSNLVNEAGHPSTIVIPTIIRLVETPGILRLHMERGRAGLDRDRDFLLGQFIAVASTSFRQEVGVLPSATLRELENRVRIPLNLSTPTHVWA